MSPRTESVHWTCTPSSKEAIYWISDANAHGRRFNNEGAREKHEDQAALLPPLVQEAARRRIYFSALNLRKDGDPGCEKTLAEMRSIYQDAGGPGFTCEDLDVTWDRNAMDSTGEEVIEGDPDEWPQKVSDKFLATIAGTLNRKKIEDMTR
jgi:hypothetical protein